MPIVEVPLGFRGQVRDHFRVGMGRAFSPSDNWGRISWATGPDWYGIAPLALGKAGAAWFGPPVARRNLALPMLLFYRGLRLNYWRWWKANDLVFGLITTTFSVGREHSGNFVANAAEDRKLLVFGPRRMRRVVKTPMVPI